MSTHFLAPVTATTAKISPSSELQVYVPEAHAAQLGQK
jgi:hypothetical protein